LTFGVSDDGTLYAWVHVEREPGAWARQELTAHVDGGWRLSGPVEWTNERGEPADFTARIRSRPRIDGQLHRIGPLISGIRPILPASFLEVLVAANFEPLTNRGKVRGSRASPYNETRAVNRRRERRGETELHEFPPIERMLPLNHKEQLDELRRAGLSSRERADWRAMHGKGPLAPRAR
jgi:hypothetical protein